MKIVIAGAYSIGYRLAELLTMTKQDIVLIDESEERLDAVASEFDVMTVNDSPTSFEALEAAEAGKADLFVAATPSDRLNFLSCAMAKELGAEKTVAKTDTYANVCKDAARRYSHIGIDRVVHPEDLAAQDIINGLKLSWVRQRWNVRGGALVMLGIKLREGGELFGQPLKELCKPDSPYHIVAVKRGEETIIPGGDDELKLHDVVYFMTTKPYISHIRHIVAKENYSDVRNVMIMGGGSTAVRAVEILPEYMRAKIIEIDADRCDRLNEMIDTDRTMVIHGDGRDISLLKEENIRNTQAFVALTGNAETNILACLTAKRFGVRKTVAMVENIDYISMAESLDIGTIVSKRALAAMHIYQMLLTSGVTNIRYLPSLEADVAEFVARPGCKATRKRVFELGLPKGVTLGGIVRGEEGLLISGGTQIQEGDTVMAFMHHVPLEKVEKFFI